jgi:toxin secretion/phage lysis holin
MTALKLAALTACGVIGAAIAELLGGWDTGIQSLLLFMAIDYSTGLIVAGVFKASRKTEQGALESRAAFKGLLRKGASLGVILIACRLDLLLDTTIVRDAAVIAYCGSELLSITENIGLMGVPLPQIVTNAIEILKGREEQE